MSSSEIVQLFHEARAELAQLRRDHEKLHELDVFGASEAAEVLTRGLALFEGLYAGASGKE